MTTRTFRTNVRELHAKASAGCRDSVERLGRLMRLKRAGGVRPANERKIRVSDSKLMRIYRRHGGNTLKTALTLGYSYDNVRKRVKALGIASILLLCLPAMSQRGTVPVVKAVVVPTFPLNLTWDMPVDETTGFRLSYSTNVDFSKFSSLTLPKTNYATVNLLFNRTYYFQLFKTGPQAPAVPNGVLDIVPAKLTYIPNPPVVDTIWITTNSITGFSRWKIGAVRTNAPGTTPPTYGVSLDRK